MHTYASCFENNWKSSCLGYLTADVTTERASSEKTFLHFCDMKFHDNMLKSSTIATFLNAFSLRCFGKWSWVTGDESGARQMQFNYALRGQWQSPKRLSFGCLRSRSLDKAELFATPVKSDEKCIYLHFKKNFKLRLFPIVIIPARFPL